MNIMDNSSRLRGCRNGRVESSSLNLTSASLRRCRSMTHRGKLFRLYGYVIRISRLSLSSLIYLATLTLPSYLSCCKSNMCSQGSASTSNIDLGHPSSEYTNHCLRNCHPSHSPECISSNSPVISGREYRNLHKREWRLPNQGFGLLISDARRTLRAIVCFP